MMEGEHSIPGKPAASTGPSPAALAALDALRKKFAEKLPAKIADLRRAFENVTGASSGDSNKEDNIEEPKEESTEDYKEHEALVEMHRLAHNLHGSGASFGLGRVSKYAGRLELLLQEFLNQEEPPAQAKAAVHGRIAHCIRDLEQISNEGAALESVGSGSPGGTEQSGETAEPRTISIAATSTLAPTLEPLPVYLLDSSGGLKNAIDELGYFGVRVRVFANRDDFLKGIAEARPAAVLLNKLSDLMSDDRLAGIPIMFVGETDDVPTRLRALRAGVRAFFAAPPDIMELLAGLDGLTNGEAHEPFRVLIVDDEVEAAQSTALILESAGMLTEVIADPLQVLDALRAFEPDLILMDIYMPHCDGRELAGVIRQMERFVSVPIVYLSTETSTTRQLDAVGRGADDFLTKPIEASHLIAAVNHRAKRSRLLRSFMIQDGLTGLLNHSAFKNQLNRELARALEMNKNLSLALLDIDYFKSVNDTHGHAAGDRVIKILARMLRSVDGIAGRYGGEEFALMLPGVEVDEAAAIMERLRVDFGRIIHRAGDREFPVSFSCGIAGSRDANTPTELIEIVDKALYQAKHAGRNRIQRANHSAK